MLSDAGPLLAALYGLSVSTCVGSREGAEWEAPCQRHPTHSCPDLGGPSPGGVVGSWRDGDGCGERNDTASNATDVDAHAMVRAGRRRGGAGGALTPLNYFSVVAGSLRVVIQPAREWGGQREGDSGDHCDGAGGECDHCPPPTPR